MSRKNFKVATTENGMTTSQNTKHAFIVKKTNVPTGKVTTLEDKKKRREEREKQYQSFRIAALERRAKRMGLAEGDIQKAKEKLLEQLKLPQKYMILLLFNRNNDKMITEMCINNKIEWLMKSDSHMYIEGDAAMLAKIRELMPEGVKIHPHCKKHPDILPKKEPPKKAKKPLSKAEKKLAAKNAKLARKKANISRKNSREKGSGKAAAKLKKRAFVFAKKKARIVAIKAKHNVKNAA